MLVVQRLEVVDVEQEQARVLAAPGCSADLGR
jgi:hypothetical protein